MTKEAPSPEKGPDATWVRVVGAIRDQDPLALLSVIEGMVKDRKGTDADLVFFSRIANEIHEFYDKRSAPLSPTEDVLEQIDARMEMVKRTEMYDLKNFLDGLVKQNTPGMLSFRLRNHKDFLNDKLRVWQEGLKSTKP